MIACPAWLQKKEHSSTYGRQGGAAPGGAANEALAQRYLAQQEASHLRVQLHVVHALVGQVGEIDCPSITTHTHSGKRPCE
jgi:hypothetical protein